MRDSASGDARARGAFTYTHLNFPRGRCVYQTTQRARPLILASRDRYVSAHSDRTQPMRDHEPAYVYFLSDPRTSTNPVYVGSTSCPIGRAQAHRCRPSGPNTALRRWKEELRAAGLRPTLVVVSKHHNRQAAFFEEWQLIHRMIGLGIPLVNDTRKIGRAYEHLWNP